MINASDENGRVFNGLAEYTKYRCPPLYENVKRSIV
jgi:hypothetical protein